MTAPVPARVKAAPDSRLEQALVLYAQMKAQYDELETRLRTVKGIIQAELLAQAPEGSTRIATDAAALGLAYNMSWVERTDLDTKAIKTEVPHLYAHYARKSGHWKLRKAAP